VNVRLIQGLRNIAVIVRSATLSKQLAGNLAGDCRVQADEVEGSNSKFRDEEARICRSGQHTFDEGPSSSGTG
jgi:hypothetical protein